MPCNHIVCECEVWVHVAAVEPQAMFSVVSNEELDRTAHQVREDLASVVKQVGEAARR